MSRLRCQAIAAGGMLVVRRLYATGGPWGTGEGFTVLVFTPGGTRIALHTWRTEKLAWAALRRERAASDAREEARRKVA